MAKKKKDGGLDRTGFVDRGRHTFHPHEHEVIRAWLRGVIHQVQAELDKLKAYLKKNDETLLHGRRDYLASVLSYLNGRYRGGTASMDVTTWNEAWTHTTTTERHVGPPLDSYDQQTIPGME